MLATFTYYPTVATLANSFFSAGTAIRPSVFVGLENYQMMLEDEIFWKVLANNLWFAAGTIPAFGGSRSPPRIWERTFEGRRKR